ncbi:MAG: Co2+/Mg2+ efflux protein ApaG [Magnetovibrio sp.]|nr:Co2+/Mg2+ efflux protein ApaG [Magnetovibrio sp.]
MENPPTQPPNQPPTQPNGVYALTTRSISISVEPEFLVEHSAPADHRYVWAYHVSIENLGSETVQLKSRYWHITDEHGIVQEVTGDGVVGEQPVLGPGDCFDYSSGTPLTTASGMMHGHYVMETEAGERFMASIPVFSLDSPDALKRFHS